MQYVVFTTVDGSGNLPLDLFLPQSHLGHRAITWQQPEQKQAEQNSSSWASTLFKAALIGTALAGAAYVGYRQGFFDGAEGMFDTMKEHFENAARQNSDLSPIADPENLIDSGASEVARTMGSPSMTELAVDYDSMKQYFVKKAAQSNPLMNANPLNINTTAISETVLGYVQSAKNHIPDPVALYDGFKNDLFWGAITVTASATSLLLGTARCLGAVRGLYR